MLLALVTLKVTLLGMLTDDIESHSELVFPSSVSSHTCVCAAVPLLCSVDDQRVNSILIDHYVVQVIFTNL